MTFQKGDKVTQRGIWMLAVVKDVGAEVSELQWHEHAKNGMPASSYVPNADILSWEEAQLVMGAHDPTPMEEQKNERTPQLSNWYSSAPGAPEDEGRV